MSHAAVTPLSRSSHYERLETRRGTKDARLTTSTAAAAAGRPKKRWSAEKRALLIEVTAACKKHNQPHITEKAKDIFLGAVGDLLNGGYDLALIRTTALNAALEYDGIRGYSKLSQLRMRVRAAQTKADLDAHTLQRAEESRDASVATAADARRILGRVPMARSTRHWTLPCSTDGCQRTSLYGKNTCVEHSR